jgi:hypothetical protein
MTRSMPDDWGAVTPSMTARVRKWITAVRNALGASIVWASMSLCAKPQTVWIAMGFAIR